MIAANELPDRVAAAWKRALGQFLALPLAVVIGFVLLAIGIYWVDDAWSQGHVPPGFAWLGQLLGDSDALATLLSTIASSIITVTSITFSLLLIALQQGSSALTTQVTDQFLMRRMNQFYFGFFVGLSVFVLLVLITASGIHRPVFGTAVSLTLTMVALCMIVVMIYNTIDQMRPTQIVRAIHRHVLRARAEEARLLEKSRRAPRLEWPAIGTLRAAEAGHIVAVDIDGMRDGIASVKAGEIEVQIVVPMGRYLAFGDPVAVLRAAAGGTLDPATSKALEGAVFDAIDIEDGRDLGRDPAYGIEQLATIAWTSISTAKSNPNPGQAVIQSLRDILSRWATEGGEIVGDPSACVVIVDAAPGEAMDALESIILATSESMQAQTLTDALRTVAILIAGAPAPWAERLADVARRGLSSLGEHVLTRELESVMEHLASALAERGFGDTAETVRAALAEIATTLGALNSRSTRVPSKV